MSHTFEISLQICEGARVRGHRVSIPNALKPKQRRRMSGRIEWMIYGANGYSGQLVAAEARRRGLNPVLAGRRAGPIAKLAAELGLPMRVFGLHDAPVAAAAIADIAVVANCAGPFAAVVSDGAALEKENLAAHPISQQISVSTSQETRPTLGSQPA
jgi:uncharacterized protein YbjT (DUF2867 family)